MEPTYCPISGESPQEERINCITHLVGIFLSVIGSIVLLGYCLYSQNTLHLISCLIYSLTLIALYSASSYYHSCIHPSTKQTLKIVDHVCIYLLIAGTYTPFTLGPLRDLGGWTLLLLVWSIAIVGIIFTIFAIDRFKWFSLASYLGMGWLILMHIFDLQRELSFTSLVWLVAGGILYSLGTLFYVWEKLSFNHAIWHLFVLGGSVCHYFSIFYL